MELAPNRSAQAGAHYSAAKEHQSRCLKSTTVGVAYSSDKLAGYSISSRDLSACHNKPEIKQVLPRVTLVECFIECFMCEILGL